MVRQNHVGVLSPAPRATSANQTLVRRRSTTTRGGCSFIADTVKVKFWACPKKCAQKTTLEKLRRWCSRCDESRLVSRSKTNLVESRAFSNRLEEAVARYHAGAISAVEMIQELIALAKDMQAARARGEEQGLSPEEIAFYDALAEK